MDLRRSEHICTVCAIKGIPRPELTREITDEHYVIEGTLEESTNLQWEVFYSNFGRLAKLEVLILG